MEVDVFFSNDDSEDVAYLKLSKRTQKLKIIREKALTLIKTKLATLSSTLLLDTVVFLAAVLQSFNMLYNVIHDTTAFNRANGSVRILFALPLNKWLKIEFNCGFSETQRSQRESQNLTSRGSDGSQVHQRKRIKKSGQMRELKMTRDLYMGTISCTKHSKTVLVCVPLHDKVHICTLVYLMPEETKKDRFYEGLKRVRSSGGREIVKECPKEKVEDKKETKSGKGKEEYLA
ncbi:hypothetical protein WN51_11215 [Melipona quadrifasciata]|uniref:Uncharacterized protein n=1 Tax=Melipona quadrifasciata TaxID=166423 RepID=A0A0M9A6P0_9HYME|nr:hypothetical protein WN51_11215 [Melipona quadrifasciata]